MFCFTDTCGDDMRRRKEMKKGISGFALEQTQATYEGNFCLYCEYLQCIKRIMCIYLSCVFF